MHHKLNAWISGIVLIVTVGACTSGDASADGASPQSRFQVPVANWTVQAQFDVSNADKIQYKVKADSWNLESVSTSGSTLAQRTSSSQTDQQSHPITVLAAGPRVACTYDDWAFLPTDATSGLQCGGHSTSVAVGPTTVHGDTVDPGAFAAQLEGEVGLPNIRIRMNPSLGLVNVPTWFWVEGYQGQILPLSRTIGLRRVECHTETSTTTSDDGSAASVETHNVCTTTIDYLTVEVRLFPTRYAWSFGDGGQQQLACTSEPGTCATGLGSPFQDADHPSPIAHPYGRSSLHVGGAYPIGLAIDFGAQFRFHLNATPMTDWTSLPARHGDWTGIHPVQEAQAVLVRP